jgi:hypothetical protein
VDSGIDFKTRQFMAPALTVQSFNELVVLAIKAGSCPQPTLFLLSDVGEKDDNVMAYGTSLLQFLMMAGRPVRLCTDVGWSVIHAERLALRGKKQSPGRQRRISWLRRSGR